MIFDIALQDVADTVPEPTLPDTIPGDLDSVPQDAQGQPEDQQVSPAGDDGGAKAAPMSDQHPGGDGNVAKAPAEPDKQSLPPNDPAVDGEALDDHELQSLASTMSLGPPWETEFYQYKREGDQWVKSVKGKYASLAIARGWKLGPIPATEDPVVRCEAPVPALSILMTPPPGALPAAATLPAPTTVATPAADEVAAPAATPVASAPTTTVAVPAATEVALPAVTAAMHATAEVAIPAATPTSVDMPAATEMALPAEITVAMPAAAEVAIPAATPALPATTVAMPAAAEVAIPAATPALPATTVAMPATAEVAIPAATPALPATTVAMPATAEVAIPAATTLAEAAPVAMPAASALPAATVAVPAAAADAGTLRIDWTTHKKEGMRLKRLMEESAHGAEQFPHMHKLWQSGREGQKQLLRDWVLKNGDAGSIEAQIVLQRSKSSNLGTQRELLTVKQMREDKKWPDKKIKAILSRGEYVEDEDCPDAEELRRYWCNTSTTLNENEEVRQQSTMTIQSAASADAVDSLMTGPGATGRRSHLSGDSMEQIMQSLQQAANPGLHMFFSSFFYSYFHMWVSIPHISKQTILNSLYMYIYI